MNRQSASELLRGKEMRRRKNKSHTVAVERRCNNTKKTHIYATPRVKHSRSWCRPAKRSEGGRAQMYRPLKLSGGGGSCRDQALGPEASVRHPLLFGPFESLPEAQSKESERLISQLASGLAETGRSASTTALHPTTTPPSCATPRRGEACIDTKRVRPLHITHTHDHTYTLRWASF